MTAPGVGESKLEGGGRKMLIYIICFEGYDFIKDLRRCMNFEGKFHTHCTI
jgi:hypothetical protein